MEDRRTWKAATDLWLEAYGHQMEGELDRAIELYRRSIEAYPTPEAHTFLGWTMGLQGRFDEAVHECLLAIEIDPEFGNPYNDIGVYLMPRDQLGRVYVQQGRWWKALRELEAAVRVAPGDARASRMLHHLRGQLN